VSSYHCEELDIHKCNILGSCILFENCAHWCIDLTAPTGAVCGDAPPNGVGARDKVDSIHATDSIENKNSKTYECTANHAGVLTCAFGFCAVKPDDWCAKGWSCRDSCACCKKGKKRDTESTCKSRKKREVEAPRSVSDSPAREVADVKPRADIDYIASTDSVDDKSKKTYMCTDTRRGVLTCQWDFCYVEPGHWCANNWFCCDECACCRNGKKRVIAGARAVERAPEVEGRTTSTIERDVPAQVLHTYGSCPQDFWGHQSCREENSVMVVCDPGDSSWRAVGKCVGGNGCCGARRDNPYAVQCKC
jgi:hypothetical protein